MPKLFFFRSEKSLFSIILLFMLAGTCVAQDGDGQKFPSWFRVFRLMDTTRLEKVQIQNQPVVEAIKLVRDAYVRQNGHSFTITVNQDTPAIRDSVGESVPKAMEVSLIEKNISVLEALKQIAKQTGLQFRIEEFGVTFAIATSTSDSRLAKFDVSVEKRTLLEDLPPQLVDVGPLRQMAYDRATGILLYRDGTREFETGLRVLKLLGIGEISEVTNGR